MSFSLVLDTFPPIGQRNVATYIHNICKERLGSRGGGHGCAKKRYKTFDIRSPSSRVYILIAIAHTVDVQSEV